MQEENNENMVHTPQPGLIIGSVSGSASIGKLSAALAKAQGQMSGAAKDSSNPHFNARYADLASIWEACRGPLSQNELAVIQLPKTDGAKVYVTTILSHSSGEFISETVGCTVRDAGPQAVGSGITYLRRYSLAAFTGIAPDDDDGEGAEGRQQSARADNKNAAATKKNQKAETNSGGDAGQAANEPITVLARYYGVQKRKGSKPGAKEYSYHIFGCLIEDQKPQEVRAFANSNTATEADVLKDIGVTEPLEDRAKLISDGMPCLAVIEKDEKGFWQIIEQSARPAATDA